MRATQLRVGTIYANGTGYYRKLHRIEMRSTDIYRGGTAIYVSAGIIRHNLNPKKRGRYFRKVTTLMSTGLMRVTVKRFADWCAHPVLPVDIDPLVLEALDDESPQRFRVD